VSGGHPAEEDLQALLFGHFRRPLSRHLLFRFDRRRGARRFLAALADVVSMGNPERVPMSEPLTSLGVTVNGLRALGFKDALLEQLDPRFNDGLAPKRLGDHPETASHFEHWWERRFKTSSVHCIVHVHARDADQLEARTTDLAALADEGAVKELIPRRDRTRLDGALGLPGRRDVQPLPARRGPAPVPGSPAGRGRRAVGGQADGPLARRHAARALP
jgi:hypothetical protein